MPVLLDEPPVDEDPGEVRDGIEAQNQALADKETGNGETSFVIGPAAVLAIPRLVFLVVVAGRYADDLRVVGDEIFIYVTLMRSIIKTEPPHAIKADDAALFVHSRIQHVVSSRSWVSWIW